MTSGARIRSGGSAGAPEEVAPFPLEPARARMIGEALLGWFAEQARALPWRATPDPYGVWVSEIMLQQTQVAAVVPYYGRWMARFPTLPALAAADEDAVLRAWEGLGYYSRARNLLRAARIVAERHGGRLPERVEELQCLPGIGRYTAGAIASIAYNHPAPVVDGNVTRVLGRLFALRGDPKRSPLSGLLWRLAEELIPPGRARDFNPALMELGATVCTPRAPRCGACPVAAACRARFLGLEQVLPETPARPRVTPVAMAAAVIARGEKVLLARRPETAARWAGMWQFPAEELQEKESAPAAARRAAAAAGLEVRVDERLTVVRHAVTRYRVTLEAFRCVPTGRDRAEEAGALQAWVSTSGLDAFALPAAHRKIAALLQARGEVEEQLELGLAD